MAFGISHQKAGLNWAGRYKETSRERRLLDAWNCEPQRHRDTENGKGEHARWRRMTGITCAVEGELDAKERKKGLKRMVRWIEEQLYPQITQTVTEENSKSETRNSKQTQNRTTENNSLCRSPDDEQHINGEVTKRTARSSQTAGCSLAHLRFA